MTGRYKAYPEYKDSGVEWAGKIPSHWGLKKLKYLAPLISEKATQKTNPIALEHIQSWTGKLISTESMFDGDGTKFKAGDILFGKLRPYLAKVYLTEEDGEAIGDFHVMRPINSSYGKFLKSLMLTTDYISAVDASTYGAKMPRASWDFTSNIQLPFCSEAEAEKIASFLDHETAKIDTLITKQEKLIELLKEKRQAVISHAVTKGLNPDVPMKDSGVEWLGEVPEHWVVAGFKKFLSSIVDYRGKTPNKVDDGKFLVTARNIKKGIIDYSLSQEYVSEEEYLDVMSRGLPEIGDVLFTTEAPLGEVAQIDKTDIALAQRIIKFRGADGILSNTFLKYFIMSSSFQDSLKMFASGSTALGIKAERLVYLRQLTPPMEEQLEIVKFIEEALSQLDKLESKAQEAIYLMKERKIALISAAVTGKIDVRDWESVQ